MLNVAGVGGGVVQPPVPVAGGENGGGGWSVSTDSGNPRTITLTPGNVTTAQAAGLIPGNTYRIRVRAFDAAGNYSGWSNEILAVTPAYPAPATVVATTTIGSPLISGAAPATVAGTVTIGSAAAGLLRTITGAGTTANVTGLIPARQYTAQVRARDAAGNWSGWSAPIQFTTGGAGTAGPATVAATATVPGPNVGGTPPTVVAGRARPVVTNGSVLLDVTATPPGGEVIIGYAWTIQSGGGSLSNATTATPTYFAPTSGSGTAVIRAAVSSTNAGRATADVTVAYGPSIVAAENLLTGTARATWDLTSPNLGGVSTLLGFADGFTCDRSSTVNFKIAQSDTAGWAAEVYRLGWYNGDGARSYGTITPNGTQLTNSQAQPTPGDADPVTTLLSADAANWAVTLTWTPPAWAPSGIYVLRLNRTGGGASHVMFVLRDDARTADLMLMPADSTWNAYNAWGGMGANMYAGNSLYYGTAINQYNSDAARYVSYNRPVVNRGAADSGRTYGAVAWSTFFTGEYPMVRFVERNGIDVKYYGCIDAAGDTLGTHLLGNGSTRGGVKAAMFVGHNEYWSDVMRAGWERAKNRGVSVFSCASNEVFWRTVGSNADAESRPRVQECYKSTIGARSSTGRTEWTGTWRDPDGAGKGGNNPENQFTGTIFMVNGPDLRALVVPFAGGYSAQPLWRNTSVASLTTGQSFTSPGQILGFEWDTYGPAGATSTGNAFLAAPHPRAVFCSTATYTITTLALTDAGDEYGAGDITHRLVVHPGGAGAMVFGTGTTNWALGVDDANTYQQGSDNTSVAIQQATLNMLTDMGAPPRTLMSGMTQPTPVDWYPDIPTATVTATTTIPGPTVTVATGVTITASTVAATTTVPAPTAVKTGSTILPATVAATTTVGLGVGRLFIQDFEQGTAGVTITTGNSAGGTSTAWTSVFTSGGNTIARYSTMSYRGSLSGQWYAPLSAGATYGERTIGSASDVPVYARMRVMVSATADATGVPVAQFVDSAGNVQAEARFLSTNRVGLYSGAGNQIGTTSATFTGMAWADLGLAVKAFSASTGVIEMVIYNAAGTIAETITSSANLNTLRSGGANAFRAGMMRTDIMLYSSFTDDVAISTATYPMLPTATSTWALPNTVAATTAVPAPVSVTGGALATPATVAAVATVGPPSAGGNAQTAPATVTGSTTVPAPVATAGATVSPTVVAVAATVPTPAVRLGVVAAPAAVAASTTVPTPAVVVASGSTATPTVVAASTAVPSAAVTTGNAPAPPVVAASASISAPVTVAGSTATPATVTAVTVAGGAAGTGNAANPGTVTGTTSVGSTIVITGTGPAPGTVAGQAAVAALTILTSIRTPTVTVGGTTIVPAAAVGLAVLPTPAAVAVTATIGAVSLRASGTATAGTISGTTVIGEISHIVGQIVAATSTATVTGVSLRATVTGNPSRAKVT